MINAAGQLPACVDVVLGKPVTLAALKDGIAGALECAGEARHRAA